MYGSRTAAKPSVLRNVRIAFATVCPQANPRATDRSLDGGKVAVSCVSKVAFCDGRRAASAVYAAPTAAAAGEASRGAVAPSASGRYCA